MAEQKLPKLTTRVRFPSPAPTLRHQRSNPRVFVALRPTGLREGSIPFAHSIPLRCPSKRESFVPPARAARPLRLRALHLGGTNSLVGTLPPHEDRFGHERWRSPTFPNADECMPSARPSPPRHVPPSIHADQGFAPPPVCGAAALRRHTGGRVVEHCRQASNEARPKEDL